MSDRPDDLEWRALRVALGLVVGAVIVVGVAWKVHDVAHPPPTRLEQTLRCLKTEKGVVAVTSTGDILAESAGDGALKATVEGNDVTVALASTQKQAIAIEHDYRAVAGDLAGRLERRDRTVYLWRFSSSPTQRQVMYDCQY